MLFRSHEGAIWGGDSGKELVVTGNPCHPLHLHTNTHMYTHTHRYRHTQPLGNRTTLLYFHNISPLLPYIFPLQECKVLNLAHIVKGKIRRGGLESPTLEVLLISPRRPNCVGQTVFHCWTKFDKLIRTLSHDIVRIHSSLAKRILYKRYTCLTHIQASTYHVG